MADSNPPSRSISPVHSESEILFWVSTQVTYHITVAAAGKKAKPKDKKETKTKEFMHKFCATSESCLSLLTAILSKHGQEKYKVSKRQRFGIKILCSSACVKGDAIDIDNFDEYKDITSVIREKKPSKITIFVDMADIQKSFKNASTGSDGSDKDEEDQGDEDPGADSLTDLEQELARFCWLLEKQYQNDQDTGYTYINKTTSVSFPLTLVMMKEWACAFKHPPQIDMFNPENHQVILNSSHQNQPTTLAMAAAASAGSTLAEMTAFLATVMQLVGTGSGTLSTMSSGTPVIPTTPTNSASLLLMGASPAMLTPSKLPHFLRHAELHLGVPNATMYEESLQVWGYGPDVLHLTTDVSLASLGISEGDVLQLKKGCVRWWNSCDVKHKHCDSDDILTQSNNHTPPNKKVHLETRFTEGGSHTFFGPCMIEADPDGPEPEDIMWYYCEAQQGILQGFMAIAEGADEDPFTF
ncbi:hypothetical protein L208DRAFT_1248422 [Tricholoma matsutake]|nr:hypothetical protein L208DRAFT_1248422 [Tricholoma matsutake 945]